jgi:hypothetical protein
MKKFTVRFVSLAAVVLLALSASFAGTKSGCCNGGACCKNGACCRAHNHNK